MAGFRHPSPGNARGRCPPRHATDDTPHSNPPPPPQPLRSINSNNAMYKSVTEIGVEIREGLLKDIEACVDRSMNKVQGDMITINKKEWGEFKEEIVQNFEKINYDKKCHDLLVSSGEKPSGKGTGVHMNGEQFINTGGGVLLQGTFCIYFL